MVDKLVNKVAKIIEKDVGKSKSLRINKIAHKLKRKEMSWKKKGLYE